MGKAINYKHFQKYIDPHQGIDFDELREGLLKIKTMNPAELEAEYEKTRQEYFETEYLKASIEEKIDMLSEDVIQLVHQNVDKILTKEVPQQALQLIQAIMKNRNDKALVIVKLEQLQLQRELVRFQTTSQQANRLTVGYIPELESGPTTNTEPTGSPQPERGETTG